MLIRTVYEIRYDYSALILPPSQIVHQRDEAQKVVCAIVAVQIDQFHRSCARRGGAGRRCIREILADVYRFSGKYCVRMNQKWKGVNDKRNRYSVFQVDT